MQLTRQINIFSRMDWLVVVIWIALSCIGIMCIYSSLYSENSVSIFDLSLRSGRQTLWLGIAAMLAIAVFLINSRFFWTMSTTLYIIAVLLIVVTIFFGKVVNGSKSWLSIGQMSIQPIEFLKVATALLLAKVVSEHDFSITKFRTIACALLVVLLPMALALLQKDLGSAMVFLSFIIVFYRIGIKTWIVFILVLLALLFIISLLLEQYAVLIIMSVIAFAVYGVMSKKTKRTIICMLFTAGVTAVIYYLSAFAGYKVGFYSALIFSHIALVPIAIIHALWRRMHHVLIIVGMFIFSVVVCYSVDYVFDNVLKEHHRNRINTMLGLQEDLRGAGYNVHQSKVTIGSGGFWGKGYLNGTQTKFNFVPEQSTDFIFCTIGEEWGFVGTLILTTLFFILIWRLLVIAERQNRFGKIYGYCVASIIAFHTIINLAMTVGLFPVIGIPLPFISYGGSALWSFSVLIFLLLRFDVIKYE
jgi:rod shape determining protein RodA